jgi:thymidylate synthase
MGKMTITAMSSHIYSRHYDMVDMMIEHGIDGFVPVTMPEITYQEALYLVSKRGKMEEVPEHYQLATWLITEEPKYWIPNENK